MSSHRRPPFQAVAAPRRLRPRSGRHSWRWSRRSPKDGPSTPSTPRSMPSRRRPEGVSRPRTKACNEASHASRSTREALSPVPPVSARLLEGGPIATEIRQAVAEDASAYRQRHGRRPVLAVVICGRDAPSMVYLQQILRTSEKVGVEGRLVEVDASASETSVVAAIEALNDDPVVNGIIVQMPL